MDEIAAMDNLPPETPAEEPASDAIAAEETAAEPVLAEEEKETPVAEEDPMELRSKPLVLEDDGEEAPLEVEEPVSEAPIAEEPAPAAPVEEHVGAVDIFPETKKEFKMPKTMIISANAETPAQSEAIAKEAAPVKKEKPRALTGIEKKYFKEKKRLRRKYKMDKDALLSSNDVIPGFIVAKGEKVVRAYNCLAAQKGDGTVCLTNRRLLINADERSEISVNQVTGIKFSKYAKFSFFKFLFAILFFAIAAASVLITMFDFGIEIPNITGAEPAKWAVILCYVGAGISFIIGLPLLLTCVKKTFYFYIFAQQDAPFVECKSASVLKREKKGKAAKCLVAREGKESEKAARELGALLIEIKEGRFED